MFVVLNVLLGIASVRVDGAAHAGGLLAGLLLGLFFRGRIYGPAPKQP